MTSSRKVSVALLMLDALLLILVFNVVGWVRGINPGEELILAPLIGPMVAFVFAIYLIDGYKARTDMISLDYTSQHTIAVLSAMLATLLLTFVIFPAGFPLKSSRAVIAFSFLILAPATLSYRRIVYLRFAQVRGARGLLFLGDFASCTLFRDECERMGTTQPTIYSVVGEEAVTASSDLTFRPLLEVLQEVEQRVLPVEAIIVRESGHDLPPGVSQELVELHFEGIPTYTLELFHQVYWRKIPLYRINQTWLFQEGFRIAREPVFERLKRATDIGFALVGLLLTVPFVALGGLAVWLEDGRPFFYSQHRIGRNRVPFRVRKLRTMRAHAGGGDPYTRADDTRVTRVGRFLRATRIDEFPQLWNVLRGEMSLIGPRAEWDRLVADYERQIPCYHFRHLVKPGITGWAQVNYPYGASIDDTIRKLEYDLYYIRHFSFRLDASIVLKTVHVMLFGKGR